MQECVIEITTLSCRYAGLTGWGKNRHSCVKHFKGGFRGSRVISNNNNNYNNNNNNNNNNNYNKCRSV